jgi:glutathione peroxidase
VMYQQLVDLHVRYGNGFALLCFPCNQFGKQEKGTEAEIKKFVEKYDPEHKHLRLFSKINVNGSSAHPLYQYMKRQQSGLLGSFIKWNFTKFLVDSAGFVVKRYGPADKPNDFQGDIEALMTNKEEKKD